MLDDLIIDSEYDGQVQELKYRIFKCVDKFSFVYLYVFNKDVLHLGLVAKIRELGNLSADEKENLEELTWAAIDYIITKVILSPEEIRDMLALIGDRVKTLISRNSATKRIKNGSTWY